MGPLNAWTWLAEECSKVCSYFQGNAQRTRHRITWPCHFAKLFELFQRYSKLRDNNNHIHVFATKCFIMYGKHILYLSHSLSLTDSRGGHTALFIPLTSIHTHANESDWKPKPVRKVLHFATFQSSNLVNSGLWIRITCDHRQINMSQHDLLSELK